MNATKQRTIGWVFIALGVLIAAFSQQIVFPGLERLFGIEAIVGHDNVTYLPDGGYAFTNPGAVARWISSVAAGGVLVALVGTFVLLRARR